MIFVPSSFQLKCFPHSCRRGLNKRTWRPVLASRALTWVPLYWLQATHANHKFFSTALPPLASGTM